MATNPILKIKRGSGAPVSLQAGELAMDLQNKSLFIGTANGPLAIAGEHIFATKTHVSDAVAAEASLRSAADSTLTTNLNNEITRATNAEGVIAANLAQELLDRASAVSAEAGLRVSGDNALDGKIETEKGRINAILSAANANADTFKEVVDLINSVDLANDQSLAAAVLSINDAIEEEAASRESADDALDLRVDGVVSAATSLTTRVSAAEQDILDEVSDRSAAITSVQGSIASEASTRAAAITGVQNSVTAEASTRATADTSLSNRIGVLEGASADSRLTAVEADVADHESRISALETTIDGGSY
jgi:hypothetical protein